MLASTLVACSAPGSQPIDDDFVGGKADGVAGFEEGSADAIAILELANTASFEELDDDAALDRRAAEGIIAARPARDDADRDGFQSLAELDAVSFVGPAAMGKLHDFALSTLPDQTALRVATFNLRWYGLDGDLFGSFGSESRTETLRAFIDEHLSERDVIVFQEVVDFDLFTSELMFDRECVTYDGFSGKHQRVVVCHDERLTFWPLDEDGDFALEELNTGFLRPGVMGRLATDGGTPLVDIVGVHLKANEHSTERRLEQAEILAEQLADLRASSPWPLMAIGDFNTHQAIHTGLDLDDEITLSEILEADDLVTRVPLPVDNTYREKDGTAFRLDQAWVSPTFEIESVQVPGACNLDFETQESDIARYVDEISDHCAVLIDLHH